MSFLQTVSHSVKNVSRDDLSKLDEGELKAFAKRLDEVADAATHNLASIDALLKWCQKKRRDALELRRSVKLLKDWVAEIQNE